MPTLAELEREQKRRRAAAMQAQLGATDRGAPFGVRVAVSMAPDDDSRLATARQYFKDAQYVDAGGEQVVAGIPRPGAPAKREIVYTDPKTNRRTALDVEGLDFAKAISPLARTGAYATGAVVGGAATGGNPVGALAGGAIASKGTDILLRQIFDVQDTRPFAEKAASEAIDIGSELALGATGTIAGAGTRAAARRGMNRDLLSARNLRGFRRPGMLADLQQAGVPLEGAAPLVNQAPTIKQSMELSKGFAGAGERVRAAVDKTRQGVTEFADRLFSGLSRAETRTTAGSGIQKGISDWATRTQAVQSRLESELNAVVPKTMRVKLDNVRALIDQRKRMLKEADASEFQGDFLAGEIGKFDKLIQRMESTGERLPDMRVTWEFLRAIRSRIGEKTDPTIIKTTTRADLNQLYGAITKDMEASVANAGPAAVKAFERTQAHWAARQARLEMLEKIADSELGQNAFKTTFAGAENGAQLLRRLRKTVPTENWNDLVAVKLREMGMANKGASGALEREFSPERFIQNWRGISTEGKNTMLGQNTPLRQQLDRLARISGSILESREFRNFSNTAMLMQRGESLTESVASAFLTGKVGLFFMLRHPLRSMNANSASKLMTNPAYVKWLGDGSKINFRDASGITAHIGRLSAIAAGNAGISDEIEEYLQNWSTTLGQEGG